MAVGFTERENEKEREARVGVRFPSGLAAAAGTGPDVGGGWRVVDLAWSLLKVDEGERGIWS